MPAARVVLLAGGVALMSIGAATGALAQPVPSPPVIVPLDVTMEDTGWLESKSVLARLSEGHIAASEPVSLAVLSEAPVALEGNEAPFESSLALLAVPRDFSITVPAVAPSPSSSALAAPVNSRVQSPPARATDILNGNQRVSRNRAYKVTGSAIEFDIPIQLNGDLVGKVPLKIGSDRNISVQLADLLALLKDRVDPQLHEWLSSAYSVNSHISFDQLRSAGIDVSYDAANDSVVMVTN